jgi:cell division protein FtsB
VEILQFFFNNFWLIVIFLFFFGGSIWAAVQWIIRHILEHQEKMQEMRNEELRLQLQIAQANKGNFNQEPLRPSTSPALKDASWEERAQTDYETGYQQQSL